MANKISEQDDKLKRLIDSVLRLRAIHEMRWNLLNQDKEMFDADIYVESNELLTEAERSVWQFIDSKKD